MAYVQINGARVTSGRLAIPFYGIWIADVEMADDPLVPDAPGGVEMNVGDLALIGTAYRQASYGGSRSLRVVGGYGGWSKRIAERPYQFDAGIPRKLILADVAASVGERLEIVTDLGNTGAACLLPSVRAGMVLAQLGAPLWWMRADGVTVIGERTSGAITSQFTLISYHGGDGRATIAAESIADFAPGRSFSTPTVDARTISAVLHTMTDSGQVRTIVSVSP